MLNPKPRRAMCSKRSAGRLHDIDKAADRYPHRILMRIKSTEAERREVLPPNCPASCDSDSVLYAPLRNLHVLASSLPQLAVASRIRSVGARLRLQPGGEEERQAPSALMHSKLPQPPRDLHCRAPAADLPKNGPNPFSVIPVRFFSSSDFMILF